MIEYVKEKFLENPEAIKSYMEHYDYCHVKIRERYISLGRDEKSSPKSIVIRLVDNEPLLVHDYARNLIKDIFGFVMVQRGISFREAIYTAREILGIGEYEGFEKKYELFGGFYSHIRKKNEMDTPVYSEDILDQFSPFPNRRFLRDGISIPTQKFFRVGFDVDRQAITIPIRNEVGNLIGVKGRVNGDEVDGMKYYYIIKCPISRTLFGYCQNYPWLQDGDVFIFESEKSVMQLHSMGIRNAVALGSSSISKRQVQLVMLLNPERVWLLLDKGLEKEAVERNVKMLRSFSGMREFTIKVWKPSEKIPDKSSPSDLGEKEFKRILEEECYG